MESKEWVGAVGVYLSAVELKEAVEGCFFGVMEDSLCVADVIG